MKDNYNIKINPPKLSSEDISKHMNFEALLDQINQTERPAAQKNRSKIRYLLAVSITAAASILLFFGIRSYLSVVSEEEVLALNAPFASIKKDFTQYELDADKGDTIVHSSGSLIIVPASAFVDSKGNQVNGKVDIKYRELADPVDMFIAGVPQNSDNTTLQTAGMMHIEGFKDGKPVFINKDKDLQVELRSTVSASISVDNMKAYAYNKDEKNWKSYGAVSTEILASQDGLEINTDSFEYSIPTKFDASEIAGAIEKRYPKPVKPIAPSKGTPKDMIALGLDFNIKEFPEFTQYENVEWVASKAIVSPLPENGWSDMKVIRIGDLKYEIVMIPNEESKRAGRKEVRFEATPLIPYTQQSIAEYERALNRYNTALSIREEQISRELINLEKKNIPAIAEVEKKKPEDRFRVNNIVSRFTIPEFGLWSAANMFNLNSLPIINASFKDSNGNNIDVAQVYVSDAEKQLYFSTADKSKLHYNIESEHNQLWVMSNGQLYVAGPMPKKENDIIEFVLEPAMKPKTENDIRRLII
jgi:hypothetical protein